RGKGAELRPGCSIGVALGQLEIPPVGANSVRTVDAAASARKGRSQQHVALGRVALSVRNSHQIRPHLPGSVTGQSWSRLPWAVPCEGMCGEQSRRQRTIATSRSEATTTETNPKKRRRQVRRVRCDQRTGRARDVRPALPKRENPEGCRFRLTNSFRNG